MTDNTADVVLQDNNTEAVGVCQSNLQTFAAPLAKLRQRCRIEEADFFTTDLDAFAGRNLVTLINPPFGHRMGVGRQPQYFAKLASRLQVLASACSSLHGVVLVPDDSKISDEFTTGLKKCFKLAVSLATRPMSGTS